jgi:hypothetical protein
MHRDPGLSGSDRQIVVALSPPRSVSCRCPTPTRRPLRTERNRSPPLGKCELSTPLLSGTLVCYREFQSKKAISDGVRSLN